jgi:hypothetical protein
MTVQGYATSLSVYDFVSLLHFLICSEPEPVERETRLELATSTLASMPPNVIVFPGNKHFEGLGTVEGEL